MDGQARPLTSALCAAALALCVASVAPSVHADPTNPPADPTEEARRLFAEGSELFLKHRYQEALDAVQRSYLLVPSPNSALIAARCLRDLGRPEEAAQRFADAAAQAEARAAAGEQQYVQTAEAARKEGALLRGTLANLRVRVANAPEGTTVETGATRTPVARGGLVELLHRPGRVVVVVRTPAGVAVRRAATLSAGAWTTVDVDVAAKEAPPTAVPPPLASASPTAPASAVAPAQVDAPARRRAWMFPAGLVLGGVGLVGVGSFVGFGLKSRATYNDLEDRCAPRCGDAEREEAEGGERDAMIANVALAIGAVGLVGGVTLVALGWPQQAAKVAHRPAAPRRALSLSVGPGGVAVRGSLR